MKWLLYKIKSFCFKHYFLYKTYIYELVLVIQREREREFK